MPSPGVEAPSPEEPLEPSPLERRSRWWWVPGTVLLVAFVAFVFSRRSEEEAFVRLLRQARPEWLLAAAAFQLGTYLCVAGIWQRVLARTGVRAPLTALARLSLMKIAFDQVVPTAGLGGSMVVASGLRRRGATVGTAAASVMVTTLSLYAAQALAIGASLTFLWTQRELSHLVLWLASAFSVVAALVPVAILLAVRYRHWKPAGWMRRVPLLDTLRRAVADVPPELLRDPWLLTQATALQVSIFLLDALTLGAVLRSLGVETALTTVFVSFMMAAVAETVSVIPGGVGTFEAASVGMLNFLGVPVEAALAGTMLLRGFTLWMPLLPGFYFLRWNFRRETPANGQPSS